MQEKQYNFLFFDCDTFKGSDGKESACNVRDLGFIPGYGNPLEMGMTTHYGNLAGEFHGQRSLVGDSPWDCKESYMNEQLTISHF